MAALPASPKRSRRTAKSILAGIAIVACLLLGWRWQLRRDVNARLAAIKHAGFPTSGAELNDFYPPVAVDRNAALVITQAFALMKNYADSRSNEIVKFRMPLSAQALTAEQKDLLSGYVEMNGAALVKVREALLLPNSRYPIDMTSGLNALLPHINPLKNLAQAASYEGVLAADSGRQADAVISVVTILGLSRTLAEEPLLISALVRFRMNKMATETLERCLNASSLDDQQLRMLGRSFGDAERTNEMAQAMIGERATTIPCFRMNFAELERFGDSAPDFPSASKRTLGSEFLTVLIRASGFFERDLRFYLKVMETNISLAGLPLPQSLEVSNVQREAETEMDRWHYIMSAMLLPALPKAFLRHAESAAFLRLSQCALALERYRHSYGRLPSDLNELPREFLPIKPTDPFDGALLRYRRLSTGYVIYSVGEDRQDNDGKAKPANSTWKNSESYDLTFVVRR